MLTSYPLRYRLRNGRYCGLATKCIATFNFFNFTLETAPRLAAATTRRFARCLP